MQARSTPSEDVRVQANDSSSHMFCLNCAQTNSLFTTSRESRQCPACSVRLPAEDDCVATALNPREDYKTSILSGLSPAVIMECATRALAFYSYQASSAVFVVQIDLKPQTNRSRSYQDFRTNSVKEKYSNKIHQLEDTIHQANGEILKLRDIIECEYLGSIIGVAFNKEQRNKEVLQALKTSTSSCLRPSKKRAGRCPRHRPSISNSKPKRWRRKCNMQPLMMQNTVYMPLRLREDGTEIQ
jgi:E3 ubiquitin-protein ligase CCNP1IP1